MKYMTGEVIDAKVDGPGDWAHYNGHAGDGRLCFVLIDSRYIWFSGLCDKCQHDLVHNTSPIFLDGRTAADRGPGSDRHCSWCLNNASYAWDYNRSIICASCRPKYNAEYDAMIFRTWVLGALCVPDVIGMIMGLMVSFFAINLN